MKLNKKKLEWAYQKWCEGLSVLEIASALDIDSATIYKAFKRKGYVRIRIPLEYKEEEK